MAYRVILLKGDYSAREYAANTAGAAMVWHQHFNSFNSTAAYALVEIAYPVTDREMAVAREVAAGYNAILGGGLGSGDGVKVLNDGERAETIIDGNKEAFISEPLFVSNPTQAAWAVNPENLKALAKVNVDTIKRHYPDGSVIALSVGHRYKTSAPNDQGANVVGQNSTEANLNEAVINFMHEMLSDGTIPAPIPYKPSVPTSTLLRLGSSGAAVRGLQESLNKFGYELVVDGDFGPATDAAVREFQARYNLAVDGVVGKETMAALAKSPTASVPATTAPKPQPGPTVRMGSTGRAVEDVQWLLKTYFGFPVARDGDFGQLTHNAVVQFQRNHDLKPDGIVGEQTWRALLVPHGGEPAKAAPASAPAPVIRIGKVVAVRGLKVRSGPGTNYASLGALVNGARIEILSTTKGWHKIKFGSKTGYVLGQYVR